MVKIFEFLIKLSRLKVLERLLENRLLQSYLYNNVSTDIWNLSLQLKTSGKVHFQGTSIRTWRLWGFVDNFFNLPFPWRNVSADTWCRRSIPGSFLFVALFATFVIRVRSKIWKNIVKFIKFYIKWFLNE